MSIVKDDGTPATQRTTSVTRREKFLILTLILVILAYNVSYEVTTIDPHAELGVRKSADGGIPLYPTLPFGPAFAGAKTIKKAFRNLARRFYPDRMGPEDEKKYAEIHKAYSMLADPALEKQLNQDGNFETRALILFGHRCEVDWCFEDWNSRTGAALGALGVTGVAGMAVWYKIRQ